MCAVLDMHPAVGIRQGGVEGQHIGTIADGIVVMVGSAFEAVVVARIAVSRQVDDDIHIAVGCGTIGHGIEHAFTVVFIATDTPDTEVLFTVTDGVVLIRHLDAALVAVEVEGILIGVVAHPAAIVRVVKVVGDGGGGAVLWTGVGTSTVVVTSAGHHVGVADEGAVLASVSNLDIVTAVHTDLVRCGRQCGRRNSDIVFTIYGGGIDVVAAHVLEIGDLCHRSIEEEATAIDETDAVRLAVGDGAVADFIDGIGLSGVQRVDFTLTSEVDVGVVDDKQLSQLDGIERTCCFGRLSPIGMTVVTDGDGTFALTGVAGGAGAEDGASDVHILGVARLGSLRLIVGTIHIDVGVTGDGGVAEGALEGTPVATGPHVASDIERFYGIGDTIGHGVVWCVFDGVFTNEGIDRAEGVAVVACGIHVLVDDTATDVGDADGTRLGAAIEGACRQVEAVAIVSVTRATIDVAIHVTAGHVDGTLAGDIHGALGSVGTAEHIATHVTTAHVGSNGTRGGTQLTTAEHITTDVTTRNGNKRSRSWGSIIIGSLYANIVNTTSVP